MKKSVYFLIGASAFIGALLTTHSAYAATNVKTKVLASSLYNTCYLDKGGNGGMKAEVTTDAFRNGASIAGNARIPNLPNDWFTYSTPMCEELFDGTNQYFGSFHDGLFSNSVPTSGSSTDQVVKFLESVGYEYAGGDTSNATTECVSFKYDGESTIDGSTSASSGTSTAKICATVGSDGKIVSGTQLQVQDIPNGDQPLNIAMLGGGGYVAFGLGSNWSANMVSSTYPENLNETIDGKTWEEVKNGLINHVNTYYPELYKSEYDPDRGMVYQKMYNLTSEGSSSTNQGAADVAAGSYGISDYATAGKKMLSSVGLTPESVKLTPEEQVGIYQSYINNHGSIYGKCDGQAPSDTSYQKVNLVDNGTVTCYYVKLNSGTYYVASTDGTWTGTRTDASGVLALINSLTGTPGFNASSVSTEIPTSAAEGSEAATQSEQPSSGTDAGTTTGTTTEETNTNTNSACWEQVQIVGWLVCPILDFAKDATEWLYETFIASALEVPARIFTEDKLRTAWGTFQSFANITFVILLLIVIFSQVTGVGINNYGIKKILPQLIIAAILSNLSFLICSLAVDTSNIVGSSVYNLLNNMAGAFGQDGSISHLAENIVAGVLGVGTTIALGALAITSGIFLLILPTLIGALIGLLFLFALLSARQAVVIILIVISPLAVALYALPNTKKLFDKWVKTFSSMLMLYPICGAVMGGGRYAGELLMSVNNGSFFGFITAFLVEIVPIFFIPSLLRNSMNAVAGLGNRIGQIGRNASRGASNAIRRNDAYRNASNLARMGLKYKNGEVVRRKTVRNALDRKLGDKADRKGPLGMLGRASGARRLRQNEEMSRQAGMQARIMGIVGQENEAYRDSAKDFDQAQAKFDQAKTKFSQAEDNVREKERAYNAAVAASAASSSNGQPNLNAAAVIAAEADLDQAKTDRDAARDNRDAARTELDTARQNRKNLRQGRDLYQGSYNVGYVQARREYQNRADTARPSFVESRLATLENEEQLKAIADQENLISSGKFEFAGRKIHPTDTKSLANAALALMQDLHADPNNPEVLNRLRAIANISNTSDPGRKDFITAMHQAAENGWMEGTDDNGNRVLQSWAGDLGSHIFAKNGGLLHSVDKGSEAFMLDLAQGRNANIKDRNHYINYGLGSYTRESLNNADSLVLEGMLDNYKNGRMSAEDAEKFEELSYGILHDPNMSNNLKGNNKEIFGQVSPHYVVDRQTQVDAASGVMTETRTHADGTTSTHAVNYTRGDGTTTSKIDDIKDDYRETITELSSGVNRATGNALTDAERRTLEQRANTARSTLSRTEAGRQKLSESNSDIVRSSATVLDNATAPALARAQAQAAITQMINAARTDDAALSDIRNVIQEIARNTAGRPASDGLQFIAAQMPSEVVARLDDGSRRLINDAQTAGSNIAPQGSYDAATLETVHDRFTDRTYERVQGIGGQSEYRDPTTHQTVSINQNNLVNDQGRQAIITAINSNVASLVQTLNASGHRVQNGGNWQRELIPPAPGQPPQETERVYVESIDQNGHNVRHFYNLRTGEREDRPF